MLRSGPFWPHLDKIFLILWEQTLFCLCVCVCMCTCLLCSFPKVFVKRILYFAKQHQIENPFGVLSSSFSSCWKESNYFRKHVLYLLTCELCCVVALSAGVCFHTADILTSHRVLNDQQTKRLISSSASRCKGRNLHSVATLSASWRYDSTVCLHSVLLLPLSTLWFNTPLSSAAAPDCSPSWHYLQLQLWNFSLIYFAIYLELYPSNFSSFAAKKREREKFLFNVSYSSMARCLNNSPGF